VTTIELWAHQWGVPQVALDDLRQRMIKDSMPGSIATGTPESEVSKAVRLEAAQLGHVLWRNNVGAAQNEAGQWFRYGLANDSKQMNRITKSHDLIGIRRVLITPEMVGRTMAQFMSRETKRADWKYAGTKRELAQAHFGELVSSMGGDAGFASGLGTI
tara:strand:- start:3220 stop:3696 length:477 start_codon:yes stop_codon:yes gene_type:complete